MGANTCDGCSTLPNQPGTACGTCGKYQCNGTNAVDCKDPGANACGGCAALPNKPGTACGTCGQYQCNGQSAVSCNDPVNACGGCSTLKAAPGSACGTCGKLQCMGTDSVSCDDPYVDPTATCTQTKNQCGDVSDGCGSMISCGTCSVLQTCSDTRCACTRPDAVYGSITVAPTGGQATSPNGDHIATVIRPTRGAPGVQIFTKAGALVGTLSYPAAGQIAFDVVAVAWAASSAFFSIEVQVKYVTGQATVYAYAVYEYDLTKLKDAGSYVRTVNLGSDRFLQMRYETARTLYIDNDCVAPHSIATLP